MIKVSVEVRKGAVPFRVEVHAESITQAVSTIERRHPGRTVRVVFPIDAEEFFVADPKETGTGQDESERLLPLSAPVMRV
jgi:uncharacterized iron-regulated membrane protein